MKGNEYDLKCLKTSEGTSTTTAGGDEAVVRYLRRAEFEESIAALPPPQKQLVDSRSGQPLGLMMPIKADPPGALAVDAVWAALGGGWTRRRVQTRTRTANSPSLRSFANLARRVSRRRLLSRRV